MRYISIHTHALLTAGALIHALAAPAVAGPHRAPATKQPATNQPAIGPASEHRPWARGVPEARQRRAMALYRTGTRALKDLQFATAAARYREALRHWDHPGIHYHLAIALISLEQPLAAYRSVLAALRYDGAALHAHERMQALQYRDLLQQRVATLAVACTEPGAAVLLDGERLLAGPGQVERLVLAGEHHVVVRKPGHQTRSESLTLQPGTRTAVDIAGRHELLAHWIPWAMVGAGVAAGSLGGVLHWRASVDMVRFDALVTLDCSTGCRDDEGRSPAWLMERARREQYFAAGAYAVGTSLLVAGLVLAWRNPESSFRLDQRRVPGKPVLAPQVSRAGAGVTLFTSF